MSLLACAQQRFAKQTQTDTAAILQPPVSTRIFYNPDWKPNYVVYVNIK